MTMYPSSSFLAHSDAVKVPLPFLTKLSMFLAVISCYTCHNTCPHSVSINHPGALSGSDHPKKQNNSFRAKRLEVIDSRPLFLMLPGSPLQFVTSSNSIYTEIGCLGLNFQMYNSRVIAVK